MYCVCNRQSFLLITCEMLSSFPWFEGVSRCHGVNIFFSVLSVEIAHLPRHKSTHPVSAPDCCRSSAFKHRAYLHMIAESPRIIRVFQDVRVHTCRSFQKISDQLNRKITVTGQSTQQALANTMGTKSSIIDVNPLEDTNTSHLFKIIHA